ncbi:FAS-associated death domain protein-like [Apostichopus japonicus]|uniref:FAS-associated death domain protein-like n=1 Tax=Stichopus japonicus TaxID=307972 RepID=UPI003AB4E788
MAEKFSDDVITAVMTINNALKEPGNNEKFELMLAGLMMRDDLNQREADDIKDFQQLFITLKEKDKIRPGKIKPLLKGLGDIGRQDLQRLLRDGPDGIVQGGYESKKPQTKKPQTAREVPVGPSTAPNPVMPPSEEIMGEDLSQCFFVVVEYVGRDWRFLGRQLNLSQFDFEQIVEQHPRNLREQVQSMLELWKDRYRTKATKASLVAALRKCRMNLAADMAEKTATTE